MNDKIKNLSVQLNYSFVEHVEHEIRDFDNQIHLHQDHYSLDLNDVYYDLLWNQN
jgi:hypothetical protein